jgi:lipopolysaccharide transport protein LptA
MLGIMVAVVVCVGLTLRTSHGTPGSPRLDLGAAAPGVVTSTEDWVVYPLKSRDSDPQKNREVELRAKRMVSGEDKDLRLSGVTLKFPYKNPDKPDRPTEIAQITSKTCLYAPRSEHADFSGEVKLRTPDGFELDTEALSYDGPRQVASTDVPFTFRRNEASGSGRGFVYDAREGTLKILAEARVQTEDARGKTEISSQEATYNRSRHTVLFMGATKVQQRQDILECGDLLLDVDEAQHLVTHAGALHGSHLQLSGDQAALGAASQNASGPRELTGNKMDIYFRLDHSLEKVVNYKGDLVVHPGPKDRPEVRRIAADVLEFAFGPDGKLAAVQGLTNTSMVTEPSEGPVDKNSQRSVTCRRFGAQLDPESGKIQLADFMKDVVFTSGARRATAGHARLVQEGPSSSLLTLTDSPEVVDPEQGSRLSALTIEIQPESGDVNAREQVRHVISPRPAGSKGARGPDSETVATCRDFHYDAAHREAIYRRGALMRSATDELRAAEIRVFGPDGARHLHAQGDVISLLTPRGKEKEKEPSTIDARAREMLWDEAARRVEYTGDVVMRQRDMTTRSPKSVVYLNADGKDVERIEAGDPVVVEQGKRSATGTHGVYRTASRTFTLVGPDVVVNDGDVQSVHGRSLTFQMGDDTLHVDGREEVRTETVLHRDRPLP